MTSTNRAKPRLQPLAGYFSVPPGFARLHDCAENERPARKSGPPDHTSVVAPVWLVISP
jgi:hypothetical protein